MPLSKPLPLETFSAWLAPVRDQLPQDLTSEEATTLARAILSAALARLDAFMAGLRAYQGSSAAPPSRAAVKTLWQSGTTRLLDYAPQSTGEVILIVPSLVNRFVILDIDETRSFLRFLVDQGLRPLVIDWDAPGEAENKFTLSDYMTERLLPVADIVAQETHGRGAHLLGYCMGGVLALALALRRESDFRSLTLMATPWDFAAGNVGGVPPAHTEGGRSFLEQAQRWQPHFERMGAVPPMVLQTMLTLFQSAQILQKYRNFAGLEEGTEETRRFVLTEDWLNDGVALAAPVARECLEEWYGKNALPSLSFEIAGQKLDPRTLSLPVTVMAPQHDRIVPPESALPLAALFKTVTLHQPAVGHIGLMVGQKAQEQVWLPFAQWLRAL